MQVNEFLIPQSCLNFSQVTATQSPSLTDTVNDSGAMNPSPSYGAPVFVTLSVVTVVLLIAIAVLGIVVVKRKKTSTTNSSTLFIPTSTNAAYGLANQAEIHDSHRHGDLLSRSYDYPTAGAEHTTNSPLYNEISDATIQELEADHDSFRTNFLNANEVID